jgi:hypothetical protein
MSTDLYVTAPEYVEAMHITESPPNFDELSALAGMYLDEITCNHYQEQSLAGDPWPLRVKRFKRAVMLQIRYMTTTGIKSNEDYKATLVQSVSQTFGGVTKSENYGNATANQSGTIVCDDALHALSGTGLLYRGVMHL